MGLKDLQMEICRVNSLVVMAIMALVLALVIPSINAHAPVPAPAPAPTSDGLLSLSL